MPPTRRKSAQQPTLTFNSRPNKITKPTSSSTPKTHKPIQKKVTKTLATPEATKPAPIPAEVDAKNVSEPTTAEVAIENQVKAELAKPELDEREETAKKVTDAQIKRYWKAKEQARKAPRVHQEGLSLHEKILREWDLSSQFGPCIGIARVKRWKRADGLGLHPPIEVLAVLLKEDAVKNIKSQRAHLDELMSSRFIID